MVLVLSLLLSGGMSFTTSASNASDLIINEFLADNGSGLTDEDGDYSDWIEIYNRGRSAVNLGGWALTDDPVQPQKWPLPDMILGSDEYLLVFASGKNRTSTDPGAVLHTNFKLSKTGEFLALYHILEDRFMDIIEPQYPEQFRDTSYGRYGDDLNFAFLTHPTPGFTNDMTSARLDTIAPVQFSAERGFYSQPFLVELTGVTPGATIKYTTDGSAPTESNGAVYTEPIPVKTTTLLRVAAFKPNSRPSPVETHSYIFLDDVLAQPAAPAGFPSHWGTQLKGPQGAASGSLVAADYEMDPDIVNDPEFKNMVKEGLTVLPTLSLVMDGPSFDHLYTNPADRGKSSEQPVSVEFISPDGSETNFLINAGIRPEGDPASPKQSFRLLFKGEYGASKLVYPLFSDSSVTQFNSLLLLAGGDDGFAGSTSTESNFTYARNPWLRASQLAMSDLGVHDRFVHLYLNGLYWGVYNLAERPDASFMASYLGGEKEDWFMANQEGPLGNNDGAGRLDDLFTLVSLSERVGHDPDQLAPLLAEITGSLDPAQLSDYLILNWYVGVEQLPRQWTMAIRRQDVMGRRGKIIADENDEAFRRDGANLGQVNGFATDPLEVLFQSLKQDPDFRLQLADRLYQHLFAGGALTDANAQQRWQQLAAEIDPVILGEAARWGDANRENSPIQDDWGQATKAVLVQMDGNAGRLMAQAREAGLYPQFDPPVFSTNGGLVESGFALSMAAPASCPDCVIYYTTSGSDPRMPYTGQVYPEAMIYTGPVVLTKTTQLKARTFNPQAEQSWSALNQATYHVTQPGNKLRITEVMYNPRDGDDYEFIELKNVGDSVIELANISLDEGIRFTFPPNTPPLEANGFVVLVSNPAFFAEKYPNVTIGGAYEGHFSNKGEKIILRDAGGQALLEFEYNDENGWPVSPDGRGDSLVLRNENGDPNDPNNWLASRNLYGSPGTDEP
ncbi:MAG: lamin tail domain-containing protein [Anaerolineae bacterium]|nr:lamin tail domain-containing protein [Anaerolineae bacterium]